MTTFYVTFPVGGILRNRYTTVEADSMIEARTLVIDMYGRGDCGFAGVYATAQAAGIGRHNLRHIPFGPIT